MLFQLLGGIFPCFQQFGENGDPWSSSSSIGMSKFFHTLYKTTLRKLIEFQPREFLFPFLLVASHFHFTLALSTLLLLGRTWFHDAFIRITVTAVSNFGLHRGCTQEKYRIYIAIEAYRYLSGQMVTLRTGDL